MKNNKFIATSIASIMLVAGMAMPKALAATSTETRYAKEYIDSNSYAIAVGLANGNKVLTRSDLTDLVKTHGVTLNSVKDPSNKEITAASAQVPNGSKVILSDGNTATVVLYGDIEADGKIDLNDAQAIFDAYTGAKTVTGAALKAADIEVETSGEAKVDLSDPQRLFDYLYNVSAMENDLVVATKKLPENNSTIDANINIELIEEYVNNVNEGAFAVKVNLNKALNEKTTYKLSVVDEKGKDVSEVDAVDVVFNISDESDGNPITVISVAQDLDFSSLGAGTDGTYTIVLKDADGNVVARKTVQKVSKSELLPAAVKIETKRTGVHTAKLSFVGNGATEATKMYYKVVAISDGSTNLTTLKTVAQHETNKIKTMAISGNKLDLTEIASDLTEGTPYKVVFAVLDKYGNASKVAYTAVINDGNETEAEKKPTVVTMIASNKTAAESGERTTGKAVGLVASATPAESLTDEKILFRLYDKSGNIVEEKTADASTNNPVSVTFDVDKAGEYYVGALVVSTTGTRANSEELIDPESTVTVKQLTAPSAITFAEKAADATDKTGTISWVGVNPKTEKASLNGYTVTFYKYDPDNKEFVKDTDLGSRGVETITSASVNPDENNRIKKEMTTFTPNVVYKVKIAANAATTATDVIDSEETESEAFFILHATGLLSVKTGSVGTNSITLQVKKDEFAFEKEHTYDINIWTDSSRDGSDETASLIETKKSVKISSSDDTNDYIVIDGLTENGVTYYFELVLNYDGKSDTATNRRSINMSTNQVLPSLTDLTLVDKEDAQKGLQTGDDGISTLKTDNTICFDTNKVYIKKGGKDYYIDNITATTNFEDPDELLVALNAIKLGLKNNDVIKSIDANKVTVELKTEGTKKTSPRNFGTLENKSLEIVGNNYQQGIQAIVKGGDVILSPDKSNFDVTKVEVDEGHKIIAAKDVELYILDKDNVHVMPSVQVTDSATICGVKVTGSTQYAVTDNQSSVTTFEVDASNNKLTFNNTADNVQDITVKVAQTADQKVSVQSGDIEIISNKNVKVAAKDTSARVEGKVAVTVTNANVDVSDTRLLGNKSITINYTDKAEHTITFADKLLPELEEFKKITGISETDGIDLKTDYKTEAREFNSITDANKKKAVVDFINSLGIEESYKAKIKVDTDQNTVIIKFTTSSVVKNLTINL